jgi:plastocyanin
MAPRRFPVLLAAAALCLMPAACGSDDDDSSSGGSSGSAETSETTAVTFETSEPAKGRVAIDGPKEIEAGVVEITLKNTTKGRHDAQILRVEGDRTADEVISSSIDSEEGAPIPEWITDGGGLAAVAPGESATVTEVLKPGTYYLFDTESAEGSEKPNARKGGAAKFEVTGEATTAELPETDATITAKDFSFETAGIKPGTNRLTFENTGKQLHHVLALPITKGSTIEDVRKFATSEGQPDGPPPVDFENGAGTAVIDGGQAQVAELEFKQGKYALLCFITNRQGGPPHVAMGMVDELDVK